MSADKSSNHAACGTDGAVGCTLKLASACRLCALLHSQLLQLLQLEEQLVERLSSPLVLRRPMPLALPAPHLAGGPCSKAAHPSPSCRRYGCTAGRVVAQWQANVRCPPARMLPARRPPPALPSSAHRPACQIAACAAHQCQPFTLRPASPKSATCHLHCTTMSSGRAQRLWCSRKHAGCNTTSSAAGCSARAVELINPCWFRCWFSQTWGCNRRCYSRNQLGLPGIALAPLCLHGLLSWPRFASTYG